MARRLELDELVEHFTLLPDEVARLRNKSGPTARGLGAAGARPRSGCAGRSRRPAAESEATAVDPAPQMACCRAPPNRKPPPLDTPGTSGMIANRYTATVREAGALHPVSQ